MFVGVLSQEFISIFSFRDLHHCIVAECSANSFHATVVECPIISGVGLVDTNAEIVGVNVAVSDLLGEVLDRSTVTEVLAEGRLRAANVADTDVLGVALVAVVVSVSVIATHFFFVSACDI